MNAIAHLPSESLREPETAMHSGLRRATRHLHNLVEQHVGLMSRVWKAETMDRHSKEVQIIQGAFQGRDFPKFLTISLFNRGGARSMVSCELGTQPSAFQRLPGTGSQAARSIWLELSHRSPPAIWAVETPPNSAMAGP